MSLRLRLVVLLRAPPGAEDAAHQQQHAADRRSHRDHPAADAGQQRGDHVPNALTAMVTGQRQPRTWLRGKLARVTASDWFPPSTIT